MLKSLQAKFLLIFMFALLLNIFRINMAYSESTNVDIKKRTPASSVEWQERSREGVNDSKRALNKTKRNLENKTCEWTNGKMKCAAKRAGNAIKSGADKVEDAVD